VAIIIDFAIISLVSAVVIGAISLFFDIPSIQRFIRWLNSALPGSDQVFIALASPRFAACFFPISVRLFIFFFSTTGQTVGKAVMGLRVVITDGRRMGSAFVHSYCVLPSH
jgi:uncharacterized RDD family membrane protein YckC